MRDFATCCWFDVKGEDGIIIYTHNWAPFAINFSAIEKHDTTVLDVWAVDGDYIHKNFPSAQIGDDIYVSAGYNTYPSLPDITIADLALQANPVPEPTTMLLLGTGLAGLAGFRRKFKKS